MHWALHQAIGPDVSQQGSLVDQDRLRFDFNSEALSKEQLLAVEDIVNEKIKDNDLVSWTEVRHNDIKDRSDIMQFFGDKYGEMVRVVQIGGNNNDLDGYSMELCGGTHLKSTGEIESFKIKTEGAISAGVRRIEAVCGDAAQKYVEGRISELTKESEEFEERLIKVLSSLGEDHKSSRELGDLATLEQWEEYKNSVKNDLISAEKKLKKKQSSNAAAEADSIINDLIASAEGDPPIVIHSLEGTPALLQELMNGIKKNKFDGVAIFAVIDEEKVHLGVVVSSERTDTYRAGELISKLAPMVGGKGGGKPEMARGAGNDLAGLNDMMAEAKKLLEA
tara:strand:- start:1128 stop:2135 length:1008 start_codon:yes stop_codon:yes gene_type:complete